MSDTKKTVELHCKAGHLFEHVPKGSGPPPTYCRSHKLYYTRALTDRLKPDAETLAEWRLVGEAHSDKEYVKRWTSVWNSVVRQLAAQEESWSAVNTRLVAKYVNALRVARIAQLAAERAPFTETAKGIVHQHPGFALADKERRNANRIALVLGLEIEAESPEKAARNGDGKTHGADSYKTRAQQTAEELGEEVKDFVGTDGEPL